MSDSDERGRIARDHKLTHAELVTLAKTIQGMGYDNAAIGHILRIPESVAKSMVESK